MERSPGCRCKNYSRFVLRGISMLQGGKPIYVEQKRIVAEVARVLVVDKDAEAFKENVANALKILTENGRLKKAFESAYKIQMESSPSNMCACEDYHSDWCTICQYLLGNTIPNCSLSSRNPTAYELCTAFHRRILESESAAEARNKEKVTDKNLERPLVESILKGASNNINLKKFKDAERRKRVVAAVAKMIYFDKYPDVVEDYMLNALKKLLDTGMMNSAMDLAQQLHESVEKTMAQIVSSPAYMAAYNYPSHARRSQNRYSSDSRQN